MHCKGETTSLTSELRRYCTVAVLGTFGPDGNICSIRLGTGEFLPLSLRAVITTNVLLASFIGCYNLPRLRMT